MAEIGGLSEAVATLVSGGYRSAMEGFAVCSRPAASGQP